MPLIWTPNADGGGHYIAQPIGAEPEEPQALTSVTTSVHDLQQGSEGSVANLFGAPPADVVGAEILVDQGRVTGWLDVAPQNEPSRDFALGRTRRHNGGADDIARARFKVLADARILVTYYVEAAE